MSDILTVSSDKTGKILLAVGLCKRAGKLVAGTPMVCEAMARGGKDTPVLVISASDVSAATQKKICDKCSFYHVKHIILSCSGQDLAAAIGKSSTVAAVAITDKSICKTVEKHIE